MSEFHGARSQTTVGVLPGPDSSLFCPSNIHSLSLVAYAYEQPPVTGRWLSLATHRHVKRSRDLDLHHDFNHLFNQHMLHCSGVWKKRLGARAFQGRNTVT